MGNKDYIFDDIFEKDVTFNEQIKIYKQNKKIRGNQRLSSEKFYTDKEKKKYKKESLDRHLP